MAPVKHMTGAEPATEAVSHDFGRRCLAGDVERVESNDSNVNLQSEAERVNYSIVVVFYDIHQSYAIAQNWCMR